MSLLDAIILGIIQGLSEFLPVSSSGHIELGKAILGETDLGKDSLLFTVVVHGATALSTVVVFRKDIIEIFAGLSLRKMTDSNKFALAVIISMVPAAIVGLALEDQFEKYFNGNILLVGSMLFITGLLLFLADRAKKTDKSVKKSHALIIGISQAIAILPGISRSGATISTSVLLGIDREKAARFSFLMVIPLILGKMLLDTRSMIKGDVGNETISLFALTAGFIAAFIVGIFACRWMITIVKKANLKYFAYYCFAVGSLSLLYVMTT
ncbi:MAG: undecaprenyl-diphosphate phosphatase [Cryomorphaceae bacterium]|nr:undecaprenyl-diphosphate phosphatase [Cryomorphaceae bacterium]